MLLFKKEHYHSFVVDRPFRWFITDIWNVDNALRIHLASVQTLSDRRLRIISSEMDCKMVYMPIKVSASLTIHKIIELL